MCLAAEGKITEIVDENHVIVDFGGISKKINSFLVKEIELNDIVMVHAGFIIEKIK